MRIKNHYYLSIALHLASLWNRGLSQLGNSPYWWGLICLLHCSSHSNLQLASSFLLIPAQIKRLTKIIFDSKQSRVFTNWSIWAAIGNKTFETVHSNSVTSENKTIQNNTPPLPPPPSSVQSWGILLFSTGSLNSGTTLQRGDGGRKALFSPLEVYKTSERPLSAKCLNKFCRRLWFPPHPGGPNAKNWTVKWREWFKTFFKNVFTFLSVAINCYVM